MAQSCEILLFHKKIITSGMEEMNGITGKNGVTTCKHGTIKKQAKDVLTILTFLKLPKRKRYVFLKHGAIQKYLTLSGKT